MDEKVIVKRRHPAWWLLSVVLPCIVSSVASYQSSKAESTAKASAGYTTLLDSQRELQNAFETHIREDDKQTVALIAQVTFLREMVLRVYDTEKTRHPAELMKPLPAPHAPKRAFQAYQPTAMPDTLDLAVGQMKR